MCGFETANSRVLLFKVNLNFEIVRSVYQFNDESYQKNILLRIIFFFKKIKIKRKLKALI